MNKKLFSALLISSILFSTPACATPAFINAANGKAALRTIWGSIAAETGAKSLLIAGLSAKVLYESKDKEKKPVFHPNFNAKKILTSVCLINTAIGVLFLWQAKNQYKILAENGYPGPSIVVIANGILTPSITEAYNVYYNKNKSIIKDILENLRALFPQEKPSFQAVEVEAAGEIA